MEGSQYKNLALQSKKYFQNSLAEFIYYRTYSRWIPNKERRESWIETVQRYIDFMKENLADKLTEEEYAEIYSYILNQKAMPSMRLMWSAGKAARKTNICAYNCSFIAPTKIKDFAEIMYISMCGTGVGFSVEKKFVDQLPIIERQGYGTRSIDYVIQDSKEGWGDALTHGLDTWFGGKDVDFDFSLLRQKGARLETMGGQSSGPKPLQNLLKFAREKILSRQGKKLKPIDVHDLICRIGEIVVNGGVRRSALISLSDLNDEEMKVSKFGKFWENNPQRFMANNSAVYEIKPTSQEFLKEWTSLAISGTGERGIFNRKNATKNFPKRRYDISKDHIKNVGTNPCQPFNAPVLTIEGIEKFGNIKVGDTIWTESGWSKVIKKIEKGIKPVYKYRTNSGIFYGTKDHKIISNGKKIKVKRAVSIDSIPGYFNESINHTPQDIMDGLVIGDGSRHMTSKDKIYLTIGYKDGDYFNSEITPFIKEEHAVKYGFAWKINTTISPEELPRTYNRIIPDRFFYADRNKIAGFLKGLYSANGSICGKRITLKTSSRDIADRVQIMLSSLGIVSYLTTNKATKVNFQNGEYICKESYDINISFDRNKFISIIGFIQKYKTEKLKNIIGTKRGKSKKTYDILFVDYLGEEKVYDITVDNETHTYWTGGMNVSNCGEIILRNKSFCNLSEVICRQEDTEKTLMKKIRIATILGTYQSTLINFSYISKEWKQNCEDERLLGVSLTGQWDCPIVRDKKVLKKLKAYAIEINKKYAKRFSVNQSASITCVKPSGTLSQLVDTSSGMHPRHSEYYIRRVRINSTDPLFKMVRDLEYPYCPEVGQDTDTATTFVLEFPIKSPKNSISKDDLSSLDLLKYWKNLKINYTEHNPSATISVGDEEWLATGNWVYKNWDKIGGLSFLPRDTSIYQLMPYEKINKTQYNKMVQGLPEIDFSNILNYEKEDTTQGSKELACVSGVCDAI